MAKKILSRPDFTAAFISDILNLNIASVEILESTQIHTKEFEEDEPFATAVDVRARLEDGTEVIIEIQVQRQTHFVQRFHYYLASQLVENARLLREKGRTHEMYKELRPVYGIAILEKSIFPETSSAISTYRWTQDETGQELLMREPDQRQQSLGRLAFIELDKYNENIDIKEDWRQWLEFFGNYFFSKQPKPIIAVADQLLDSSSWTKEEKDMIDERIRRRENYDMDMYSAREEGIELGVERNKRQMITSMLAEGLDRSTICRIAQISADELDALLSDGLSLS